MLSLVVPANYPPKIDFQAPKHLSVLDTTDEIFVLELSLPLQLTGPKLEVMCHRVCKTKLTLCGLLGNRDGPDPRMVGDRIPNPARYWSGIFASWRLWVCNNSFVCIESLCM
jgi:hypothetical protein